MTEHEQRVAIAEWMGWQRIKDFSQGLMMPPGTSVCGYPPSGALIGKPIELPDYTRDLNAMHEAERKLSATECPVYNETLCHICIPIRALFPPFPEPRCDSYLFHATAAQRAEALLRTLNLWRDDPSAPTP